MSSTTGIKIAALLDHLSEMQSTAANQTKEQKEKLHAVSPTLLYIYTVSDACNFPQKAEYDRIGGEAIRNSSMTALQRRRKRSELTDSDSDSENQPPTPQPSKKKPRRSLSTTAQATSSSGDLSELKDIIVLEGKKRDDNQKEMVETLCESTRVYEKTSEKYLAAILQLSKQN